MIFTETNNSLEQMKNIQTLIYKVQLKDSCINKEAAQEKLDYWKNGYKFIIE